VAQVAGLAWPFVVGAAVSVLGLLFVTNTPRTAPPSR
jgi:hypothetical protein